MQHQQSSVGVGVGVYPAQALLASSLVAYHVLPTSFSQSALDFWTTVMPVAVSKQHQPGPLSQAACACSFEAKHWSLRACASASLIWTTFRSMQTQQSFPQWAT